MRKTEKDRPCNCGSGEHYQNCCMEKDNKIIDFRQKVLDREVDQFQDVFFEFTDVYREQMAEYLGTCGQKYRLTNGPHFTKEYIPLFMVWAALNAPIVEGQSPYQRFVKNFGDRFHPFTRELMGEWDCVPEFYEAVSEVDENRVSVRSLETDKKFDVNLNSFSPFYIENGKLSKGSGLIGVLVPTGDVNIFLLGHKQFDLGVLRSLNEILPHGDSRKAYIQNDFPLILEQVFSDPPDLENLVSPHEWQSVKHRAAAELFCQANRNKEKMGILELGVLMWHRHCQIRNPRIQKEAIYAAALESITDQALEIEGLSEPELANKYGVTRDSLARRIEDMEYLLYEWMRDGGEYSVGPPN